MFETPLGSKHVAVNTTDTFVVMVFTPLNTVGCLTSQILRFCCYRETGSKIQSAVFFRRLPQVLHVLSPQINITINRHQTDTA